MLISVRSKDLDRGDELGHWALVSELSEDFSAEVDWAAGHLSLSEVRTSIEEVDCLAEPFGW